MISFEVDSCYEQDLEDDFVMNKDLTLYKFIGGDPVKAFYLGLNIKKWFEYIDREQRFLYSKDARHNKDDLEKYQNQVSYWVNRFNSDLEEEVNLAELSEFVMNNMIWEEDTEDIDKVKMAFFFGDLIASKNSKENE